MDINETKKLLSAIAATYPNWKVTDLKQTLEIWHMLLKEYNYQDIVTGFKIFATTDRSGFAPSVSQIIQSISQEQPMSEGEAWAMVSKAIRNSAYYAKEEFKKLSKPLQKAVGSPSALREMALDNKLNISVESSNFKRSYRNIIEVQAKQNLLPESINQLKLKE